MTAVMTNNDKEEFDISESQLYILSFIFHIKNKYIGISIYRG